MTKYKSSNSFAVFESVLVSLMCLGIALAFIMSTQLFWQQLIAVLLFFSVITLIVIYQKSRIFSVQFLEEFIVVNYTFLKRSMEIPYSDVVHFKYISAHKSPTKNSLKFKQKNKILVLTFLTVAESDAYIEFVKWLKSKNTQIELIVFPSNDIMNHRIQEVYGFKYRKFLKNTL